MWNTQLANFSLVQSVLCNDPLTAKAALAAGASARLTLPRRTTCLLECAIRLHSIAFVDLLMSHGATAGPAEMAVLVDQVQHANDQGPTVNRRLRAMVSVMYRHGADFGPHLDMLSVAQPTWFRGLTEHCKAQPAGCFPPAIRRGVHRRATTPG